MLLDQDGIKLEISNRKIIRNSPRYLEIKQHILSNTLIA